MKSRTSQDFSIPSTKPKYLSIALSFVLILVIAGIAIPARIFIGRIYVTQFDVPQTLQGGIELLVVFASFALAAAFRLRQSIFNVFVVIVTALYLQTHSAFMPAALALLFFETLIQTGIAIEKLLKIEGSNYSQLFSYLGRFILGVATWTLGALILSAFGLGTISHLRFYSMTLAITVFVLAKAEPLGLTLIRQLGQLHTRDKIFVLFLFILLLTQFARANYGTDFDSTWYGLRPERVLVGPHSIFDNLRLVHFVYYYPKQFEVLSLPLAGINGGLFIIHLNVVLLGIGFLAVYHLARELELSRSAALLVTILLGSIPAFSNMASTAKTDNLSNIYSLLAALYFWRWCKRRNAFDFAYAFAALLAMVGTKITAFALAPLLAIGFISVGIYKHYLEKQSVPTGNPVSHILENRGLSFRVAPFIIAGIALCAYLGLALRTSSITGIPTLPGYVGVWKMLGLSLRYPWEGADFGFLATPVKTLNDFFTYWYRMNFNPRRYGHYFMAWPGNIGFISFCIMAILYAFKCIPKRTQTAFYYACTPILVGCIAWACLMRRHGAEGTDGNYFAFPIILAVLGAAGILANSQGATRSILLLCCIGFTLLHLPIMFVSHWSWHPGTKAFDFSLDKPIFDANAESRSRLKAIGAWGIEEYLQKNPNKQLCVGFSRGEAPVLHSLSCIHEDFEQIGSPFLHLFSSEFAFKNYLKWAHPDLFIMPKDVAYQPGQSEFNVKKTFDELATNPNTIRIESERYLALDISAVSIDAPIPGK